jgi:hypothetical protein
MLMGGFPGEQKIQDSRSCRQFVSGRIGKSTQAVFARQPITGWIIVLMMNRTLMVLPMLQME